MDISFEVNKNAIGFQQKKLPFLLEGMNGLAEAFSFISPEFTPEKLTRAASQRAGLKASFSPQIEMALELLCRSIRDEASLNWFGKMNAQFLMVSGLAEYLSLNDIFRKNPEFDKQPLNAPIFVTGLPRSGTTFTHRLLSSVEQTSSIPFYRHISPTDSRWVPARVEAEYMYYPFRKAGQTYGLDAIHFVRPELADECNFGMRLGMESMIYWSMAPTYSYLEWLLNQDCIETYQIYRRVLQLEQMKQPEKRLVLKCPHHLAFLPALSKVFPEAVILQTHREPVQTLASECKLYLSLHAIITNQFDWVKTTKATCFKTSTFAKVAVDFQQSKPQNKVIHVDYKSLVENPVELALKVYKQVGIEVGESQKAKLHDYFSQNRQNKHGKNQYRLEDFGLTVEGVNKEFKAYREIFLNG